MDITNIKKYIKNSKNIYEINIPGSKSIAVRSLLLSSLAKGESIISNLPENDDVFFTKEVIKKLGVTIKKYGINTIVDSGGIDSFNKNARLYLGSSGILARFIPVILAFVNEGEYLIETSEQLLKRSNKAVFDLLRKFGSTIEHIKKQDCYPIKLINNKNQKIIDNKIVVSGKESSQFVSAAIIFASLIKSDVYVLIKDIKINHTYILMTLDLIKLFGYDNYTIDEKNNSIYFRKSDYKSTSIIVEPDINTVCHILAIAFISKINIKIIGVNKNTIQPGILFINLLKKIGVKIYFENNNIILKNDKNVRINGDFEINMFNMAEMVPTLSCLAVFAEKPIKIYGVAHIRNHETDRIASVVEELKKIGVKVDEFDDGLKIYPSKPVFSAPINPYGDHRIVMSFAMFAAIADIQILGFNCVSKTCPTFSEILKSIGFKVY